MMKVGEESSSMHDEKEGIIPRQMKRTGKRGMQEIVSKKQ